jgi:WD40 repeat protein
MVFTGTSVSALNGVAGRVLAVSPDGNTVILADTVDSPSQVIICATCTSTSHSTTPFLLPGATAAAFSPDNLKAYIVTGGSCPGTSSLGCLLVYSKVDGPQMIQLNAPANDAVFIGEGAVGYIGGSTGSWFLPVCTDTNAAGALGTVGLASEMLRPLPDGQSVLALSPPNLQTVTAKITGPNSPPLNTPGCLAPRGFLSINNTLSSTIDLGEGNFTPTQFLVSSDGSMTYILGEVLPSQRTTVNITAVAQGGTTTNPVTTYAYSLTSGPGLKVGQSIVIGGMNTLGDNGIFNITGLIQGTPGSPCAGSTGTCFAVANSAGVTASGESGTGTVTPRLPFIIAHNLTTQATSLISLVGSSSPLSASLSPSGDLLVVGADDGQVHIIDTNSFMDIDQVLLPFPQSSLCVGPGSPVTKPAITCNPDLVIVKP